MSGRHRASGGAAIRLRVMAMSVRYAVWLVPWGTLLAACAVGLAFCAAEWWLVLRFHTAGAVTWMTQAGFIPLAAAAAFLLSDPMRSLTASLPVPSRWGTAVRVGFAGAPVAASTWFQLHLAARLIARIRADGALVPPLPRTALTVQCAAFVAVALAASAVVARGRWSDLGGAAAAPAALAAIGAVAIAPIRRAVAVLATVTPPRAIEIGHHLAWPHLAARWSAVGLVAVVLAGWEQRDPWHRYRLTVLVQPRRRCR